MKTKTFIIFGCALVSCLAMNALGQFGQTVRAGEILGRTVKGAQDKKMGTIKDLAIDLENGRIVEVIVAQGGFLGVDSKLVAVPPEMFAVENEGKILRLNLPGEKMAGAPVVDISKWKDAMAESSVEQAYQYYGVTPYFPIEEHMGHAAKNPVIHHLRDVLRASLLIGTDTLNHQNEKLGKVEDLVINLPEGRVVEIAIASGHFLNMRGELSAVPPQALQFDADISTLTLDATKESLSSAPHFPARAWPDINREQATAVYQAYHVVPYFLPIGIDNSAQNQGTSQADLDITANIQKAILDTDGLSVDARAVKVTTLNGRVTLRGMVANPDEKRRMGDIAARFVPAQDVNNQLVIKETAASAAN